MTAEQLAAIEDIRGHAKRALKAAGATDASYVDLDQVTAAVGLNKASLYAEDVELPSKFRKLLKSLSSRVLGALSITDKTIYVDETLPDGRKRFTQGHEIGHDVLPWHGGAYFHDDKSTLFKATRDELEVEANAFSGELIFGAGRFTTLADQFAPGLSVPLDLARDHGASAAAAFRYYVEWSRHPVALVALSRFSTTRDGITFIKVMESQCFASASFVRKYGQVGGLFPDGIITLANGVYHLAVASDVTGRGASGAVRIDTARGFAPLNAEVFNNGQLRYLMLSHSTRLSGQKKQLVDAQGRPLLRSI